MKIFQLSFIILLFFTLFYVYDAKLYETNTNTTTDDAIIPLSSNPERHQDNCTPAAILEFPSDGFSRQDRRKGWIVLHFFFSFYCIMFLSTICDDYFVPAIQSLVINLKIPQEIAGASFMAITSASPELFVNFIGTFITQGDIGVGTVVGSNVFNILAVPACCLFSKNIFKLDWYSMTRDCLVYGISVVLLITTLWDGKVQWYEGLILVLLYIFYMLVMYFNNKIQPLMKKNQNVLNGIDNKVTSEQTKPMLINDADNVEMSVKVMTETEIMNKTQTKEYSTKSNNSFLKKVWNLLFYPIDILFSWTIPDCKKYPNCYIYSLLMCMVWIGIGSYLLTWFITAIGDTLKISDSVVGLTFLAVGSSIPEIVSCIIISKHGQGAMAVSSALGANTFEVLLCLGLPWLLKTVVYPKEAGNHTITINSSGLAYNAGALLSTLIFLYLSLLLNRFRLDRKLGIICMLAYVVFLIIGTLIELNYFFQVNLPTCKLDI